MSYEKSKAPLSLMEQLIMVFIFAFAAAVCLQAFVYSDGLSKDSTVKETAAMRATEVIETCKAYHGDMEQAAKLLKAVVVPGADGGMSTMEKTYEEDSLKVVIEAKEPEVIGDEKVYQKADIHVYYLGDEGSADTESVYDVSAAWQIV